MQAQADIVLEQVQVAEACAGSRQSHSPGESLLGQAFALMETITCASSLCQAHFTILVFSARLWDSRRLLEELVSLDIQSLAPQVLPATDLHLTIAFHALAESGAKILHLQPVKLSACWWPDAAALQNLSSDALRAYWMSNHRL